MYSNPDKKVNSIQCIDDHFIEFLFSSLILSCVLSCGYLLSSSNVTATQVGAGKKLSNVRLVGVATVAADSNDAYWCVQLLKLRGSLWLTRSHIATPSTCSFLLWFTTGHVG